MNDLLEVLQKANTLPTSTLLACAVVVVCYFGYFVWKHHMSEAAKHETQKRRLEIIKLGLEIQELQNKHDASKGAIKVESLEKLLQSANEGNDTSLLRNAEVVLRPIKAGLRSLKKRSEWLPYALVGGIVGLVIPSGMVIDLLLQQQNLTVDTLKAFFWVFSTRLAFTFVVTFALSGFFNLRDWFLTTVLGVVAGSLVFPLSAYLVSLVLKIWGVFLNAH